MDIANRSVMTSQSEENSIAQ